MATEVQTTFVQTTQPALLAFSSATDGKSKFSDEAVYSAIVEFAPDHPDLPIIKSEAAKVARQMWPGIDLGTIAKPWKPSKTDATKTVVTARSDYAPNLGVIENNKIVEVVNPVQLKQYRRYFYGGAEVLFGITLRPYEVKGEKGISAKLTMLLGVKPSESGGGRSVAETFKGYVGTVSGEDPTKGAGDEWDKEVPF